MKRYLPFILLLQVLCYSCKDEAEMPYRQFYQLITENPISDNNGVTFTASLKTEGTDAITEKGFVISRTISIDSYGHTTITPVTDTYKIPVDGEFQLRLEHDWDPGVEGTVYAYMKTTTYNYQGETVDFIAKGSRPPVIHSVTPVSGDRTGTMIIHGENFSQYNSRNKVYLRDWECSIEKSTSTEITVTYLANTIGYNNIKVVVAGMEAKLENAFHLDGPKILSISPNEIYTGVVVTIEMENFTKETKIGVNIGNQNAYIIEKSDTHIKCLCPTIDDGVNTNLYVQLNSTGIRTPSLNITVPQCWSILPVETRMYGDKMIVNNEAYCIYDYYLYKFDKNRMEWFRLSPFPSGYIIKGLFGKGDYIYVIGGEFINNSYNYILLKYHIPSQSWEKSPNSIPVKFTESNLGEWINDEYYINVITYTDIALIKYSPDTDIWTIINDNIDTHYKLFAIEDNIYALWGTKLYEYDIVQHKPGNLYYEFPVYASINWMYDIMRKDNVIYYSKGNYNPIYLFSFDLKSKQLNSLGAPKRNIYEYTFILPFNESLYIGYDYHIYKYIGP